jgi:predicted dehydrogenase
MGFAEKKWVENNLDSNGNPNVRLKSFIEQEELNIEITAVCDVFDLHLEKGIEISKYNKKNNDFSGKPAKGYKNYKDLLDDKNVDAVIVTTPDFWHGPISVAAIDAGKHVYCEKCMTRTEEETHELYRKTKENPKYVLQVGHQYHQNSCFYKAKELINKNAIGKVTLVETTTSRNTPHGAWTRHMNGDGTAKPGDPRSIDWDLFLGDRPKVPFDLDRYYNWTKFWDYGTGLAGQLMGHEYDAANQLLDLGIPESVSAEGGIYFHKDNREIPDIFNVACNFPSKEVTVMYSASLATSKGRGRVFLGHDGSMDVSGTLKLSIDKDSTQYKDYLKNGSIKANDVFFEYRPGMDEIDAITSATEKYYAEKGLTYTYSRGKQIDVAFLHLKEWMECIRFGGIPSCGIDKAYEATIACHMATTSYREQRKVFWDPDKMKIV